MNVKKKVEDTLQWYDTATEWVPWVGEWNRNVYNLIESGCLLLGYEVDRRPGGIRLVKYDDTQPKDFEEKLLQALNDLRWLEWSDGDESSVTIYGRLAIMLQLCHINWCYNAQGRAIIINN